MPDANSQPPRRRGRPPNGKRAMTDAERAQKSRARRTDAAERVEITFWPLQILSEALAGVSRYFDDHPEAVPSEVRKELEQAVEAAESISIALWDGVLYGRRQRYYIERCGPENFRSRSAINRMRADHAKRLEKIAARTGATFISRDARIAKARGSAPATGPKEKASKPPQR